MAEESTTPDLVEMTRRSLEGGAFRDLDAGLRHFAPDAVWEVPQLGSRFEGVSAIRGFLNEWFDAFKDFDVELVEVLDLGNGVVLVVARSVAVLVGSAAHTRLREVFAYVVVWVNGAIARVSAHRDVDEARALAELLAESGG
jgi:ketosteroid isomerase-like protein